MEKKKSYLIVLSNVIVTSMLLLTCGFIISVYILKNHPETVVSMLNQGNKQTTDPKNHVISNPIRNVPVLCQFPQLPTGCEITCLTMLLNWEGIQIDKEAIARKIPKEAVPQGSVGGDPEKGYLGDPFSLEGFGTYHKPIAEEINYFLPHHSLDLTGKDFSVLLSVIDSGRPVIAWITWNLQEPTVNSEWKTQEDQLIKWLVPEHCVVMIGYSEKEIILNDPFDGRVKTMDRVLFWKRWEQMGSQAISVVSHASQ